jgi:hypothetical protein
MKESDIRLKAYYDNIVEAETTIGEEPPIEWRIDTKKLNELLYGKQEEVDHGN